MYVKIFIYTKYYVLFFMKFTNDFAVKPFERIWLLLGQEQARRLKD